MMFLPPNTTDAVFIDNYHVNFGGPGVDLETGSPSPTSYLYDGTEISVFGTEYNLVTNALRPLRPLSNTFCSAGSFFADGTLANVAGAEPITKGVADGFNKIRTYSPGPCAGACSTDWIEQSATLQVKRWYPSAQTLVDGSVLVVGGANVGGLVLNEASINVPTYEIVYQDNRVSPPPVNLPILEFSADENLVPGKSYNLYPILHLLPNAAAADQIFTVAGNQAIIWDYAANALVKTLPNTPQQPRTFPSSATSVILPLVAPDYIATILVCGGSSGDIPNPVALSDCYTINPLDAVPSWQATDSLPNGPQTMSDGILLPDETVLMVNGARVGSGGGFMADDPVLQPVIYNASASAGSRFQTMPATTIPRLYHSAAVLLPPCRVAFFGNNGHQCALKQQQRNTSFYPTEYRVEVFSPPYMSAAARPIINSSPIDITYGHTFQIQASLSGGTLQGITHIVLSSPGFHTHGQAMSQRMVMMQNEASTESGNTFSVIAPRDASVMPPGQFLLFVTNNGIPSEGVWVGLGG
ncbi:hypothetical protein G7Y79_00019g047570 [Physcia stellaris]|nr:hypothetical protein G7Y79_00019g047570 [Physcia stellaris]